MRKLPGWLTTTTTTSTTNTVRVAGTAPPAVATATNCRLFFAPPKMAMKLGRGSTWTSNGRLSTGDVNCAYGPKLNVNGCDLTATPT